MSTLPANLPETRKWLPILPPGAIAEEVGTAVAAIARAVSKQRNFAGLRSNPAECALLYGYLALADAGEPWQERTENALNNAIESASDMRSRLDLIGGLSGLGWAIEHISKLLCDGATTAEPGPELDGVSSDTVDGDEIHREIITALRNGPWTGDYDLISGLVGFGEYLIECLPTRGAIEGLELVLGHLEARSTEFAEGTTWHTAPGLLPDWQRDARPDGYYNLGVAHGAPGVIHLLSEMFSAGLHRARVGRLLDRAVSWLIAQAWPEPTISVFPSFLPAGRRDTRFGWCYGDLGILAVLFVVARQQERDDWYRFARQLLDHSLARSPDTFAIADAYLCHGACGAAHVFNRIYQAEGDIRCRDAAILWYTETLNMRKGDDGIAGFVGWRRRRLDAPEELLPNPGFLDGAIGVALSLLSAVHAVEPRWDRILGISGSQG
jgi:hypothetical protein